jgi:outer membrane protein OmpA-like peptidoglycan-associated protein
MRITWKAALIAVSAGIVSACASTQDAQRAFDPAACYERDFVVYFEAQETELSQDAREVIDAMGEAVRGCRIDHVRIIGSAEAPGSQETNRQISVRRAEVMADYLAQRVGWPRSRFELLATGEQGAVTDDGLTRPMRRRARIIVLAVAP